MKPKLLIVDDEPQIRMLLGEFLSDQFEVNFASNGKEAIQNTKSYRPDIILMDIMMPEMDGYEAIQRIRGDMKMKSLPIIAVTAKAMIGDREKCIKAGASDYISKPVDIDQLMSLLRAWLYEQ